MTTWSGAPARATKRAVPQVLGRARADRGAAPLAAACGAAGSKGSDAPGAPAAAPVTLLYWTQRAPEDRLGNGVKAALDDYGATFPGKINLEVGEGGQPLGLEKIKTAIAGEHAAGPLRRALPEPGGGAVHPRTRCWT